MAVRSGLGGTDWTAIVVFGCYSPDCCSPDRYSPAAAAVGIRSEARPTRRRRSSTAR